MKNIKMSVIAGSIVLSTGLLFGCSTTTKEENENQDKQKTNHTYKIGEKANVDGLAITFTDAKLLKAEDEKTNVIQFKFKLNNTTVEKKGFTAIELEVTNADNKKLEVYPAENYGKEIAAGDSDSGSGYFESKGTGPYTVKYKDVQTKKVITWKLNLDK